MRRRPSRKPADEPDAACRVAPTFLVIGLGYVGVSAFGFFNPAFHEMHDRSVDNA